MRHLWACCEEGLRKALHNDGAASETDPELLLVRMKSLAVKRRNNLVNVLGLQRMGQERDEGVLSFLARLNGQADLCDLQVTCPAPCGKKVCFKDKFKLLQLVYGLVDKDIQQKVLARGAEQPEGQEMTLAEVVKQVEAMEMGKTARAMVAEGSGGLNRLSDHRRSKEAGKVAKQQPQARGSKECGFCGKKAHDRDVCPAKDTECRKCNRKGHWAPKCRQRNDSKRKPGELKETSGQETDDATVNTFQSVDEDLEDFFGDAMRLSAVPDGGTFHQVPLPVGVAASDGSTFYQDSCGGMVAAFRAQRSVEPLAHHVVDGLGKWRRQRVEPHARVRLRLEVCRSAYSQLELPMPGHTRMTEVSGGLVDTGAQMCIGTMEVAMRMGLMEADLLPVRMQVSVANDAGLRLVGAAFVTLTGRGGVKASVMLYVAKSVTEFFVSKGACRALGIIDDDFPRVGRYQHGEAHGVRRRSISSPPSGTRSRTQVVQQPKPLTSAGGEANTSTGNLGVSGLPRGKLSNDVLVQNVDAVSSYVTGPVQAVHGVPDGGTFHQALDDVRVQDDVQAVHGVSDGGTFHQAPCLVEEAICDGSTFYQDPCCGMVSAFHDQRSVELLAHHVVDELGQWHKQQVEPHARVRLQAEVCRAAYKYH